MLRKLSVGQTKTDGSVFVIVSFMSYLLCIKKTELKGHSPFPKM